MAGDFMKREIAEQPAVLAGLVDRSNQVSHELKKIPTDFKGVAFLARGSSDCAALLGRYAVEAGTGLPTCLIAPSIIASAPAHRFEGWLVVALSQSGETPEIITAAEHFQRSGAVVVAVTNDQASVLARGADLHIDVNVGPERAVPATKTVTAQMLACLLLASALAEPGYAAGADELAEIPSIVGHLLADEDAVHSTAAELAAYDRIAVVGRKWCYPAAMETALKLQETAGVMAHGFSSADFRHGPIAVCGPTAAAVLFAGSSGVADDDTRGLVDDLRGRRAWSILIGTGPASSITWPALGHAGECLLATVRGQQLAYHWSMLTGVDPDQPAGLRKVTLTH